MTAKWGFPVVEVRGAAIGKPEQRPIETPEPVPAREPVEPKPVKEPVKTP